MLENKKTQELIAKQREKIHAVDKELLERRERMSS
jgi:hypothetical protein